MYFERTAVYPEMDPRLQYLADRYNQGVREAPGRGDEIGVVALVADLHAWREHEDVRAGATISQTEDGWLVTGRVPIARIEVLRRAGFVRSLKAARPLRPMLDATVLEINASAEALPTGLVSSGGEGVVVGVIDSGASIVHRNFRNPDGSTRLIALWDQRPSSAPASPAGFGYGRRYGADEINAALHAVEDHLDLLGFPPKSADSGSHGTHVMDIAAGNGLGSEKPGAAPKAMLVFVHLANEPSATGPAVVGSEFGDSQQLLDAVRFIFDEAGDRPCVVNISLGTNGGAHDGSSAVEKGIDSMVRERPGRAVVVAAANSFDDGIHASGTVPHGGTVDLSWTVPRAVAGQSELEIWYPGTDRLQAQLLGPDGSSFGPVPLGTNGRVSTHDSTLPPPHIRPILFVSHRANDSDNHDNVINLFMDRRVPAGVWTVRLYGEQVITGGFHAWLERNDKTQAAFLPPHDSSHTIGSISCGHLSIAVGSYDARDMAKPLSTFTSAGPTRDGRYKPEVSAPGQDVWAANSRSQKGVMRMSGTSMAAPAVTGAVALLLGEAAARGLSLDAETIRRLVIETARLDPPLPFTVTPKGENAAPPEDNTSRPRQWDPRYGYGRVDAAGLLRKLEDLAASLSAGATSSAGRTSSEFAVDLA